MSVVHIYLSRIHMHEEYMYIVKSQSMHLQTQSICFYQASKYVSLRAETWETYFGELNCIYFLCTKCMTFGKQLLYFFEYGDSTYFIELSLGLDELILAVVGIITVGL